MTTLFYLVLVLIVLHIAITIYEVWIKISTESQAESLTALSSNVLSSVIGISTSLLLIYTVAAQTNQQLELGKYNTYAILYGLLLLAILVLRGVSYTRERKIFR